MSKKLMSVFGVLMLTALTFGYMHLFVHSEVYNFERLHVFLFNLCSGGTIILYYTEDVGRLTCRTFFFLFLSVIYAIAAFLGAYIPAVIVSLVLAGIVESIRIKRFSILPVGFFKKREPVYKKFHQASLLCLSIGLVISCSVILNNEYFHIISKPKMTLDVFFLGFSFPVSLITMSVIFSLMTDHVTAFKHTLKEAGFWNVNLGVIIFFIFIVFEKLVPQVIVTCVLFFTVIMIYYLYHHLGIALQQKHFLTSGIWFLLVTAITGILYIIFEFSPAYHQENYKWLLKLHSFVSLYGWNLCGLTIICRFYDFPVQLHSKNLIFMHWTTVLILAPIGYYYRFFAILTVLGYAGILYFILFSSKQITPESITN